MLCYATLRYATLAMLRNAMQRDATLAMQAMRCYAALAMRAVLCWPCYATLLYAMQDVSRRVMAIPLKPCKILKSL